MKNRILLLMISGALLTANMHAQTWTSGLGKLYANPTSTKIGIGTMAPMYSLHIKGNTYIEGNEVLNGWNYSYLYWKGHSLVMGSPVGSYTHNSIDLRPGGVTQEPLYSQLRLYTATGPGQQELAIQLHSLGTCFFNTPGNVGIGTDAPAYKLDVNGITRTPQLILPEGTINFDPTDTFNYDGYTIGHYSFNWRMDSWCQEGPTAWLVSYGGMKFFTMGTPRMAIHYNGNVGIGTINPGAKLDVLGTIRAHEVKVCLNQGCDYVFAPDYNLMPITELGNYVNTNRHLPEVAPAAEMEADGISLSEMNVLLLKKVEELTLYIVELNERIEALENQTP